MRILVLNCGSSSLKFSLVDTAATDPASAVALRGAYETLASAPVLDVEIGPSADRAPRADGTGHRGAARHLVGWLRALGERGVVDATAHRVVHGGALVDPVLVDDDTLGAIREASALAPLHNAPALATIEELLERVDGPAVAVFDTEFHRAMPPHAARYALPADVAERFGIRRHGFHGLAHRSMSQRWAEATGRPLGTARLVTCQLGSGASVAAVHGGRSVDTTMGFTPLEGLMMATRSGDVDPSIPGHLVRVGGMDLGAVEELLATRSGLLGVSGTSSSAGELLDAEAGGDDAARLALDMFCYRVRKQIGAYLAALGGAEAVVFGGGIGERFPEIRARILADMAWCGLVLDDARNEERRGSDGEISASAGAIEVWVLAPDEAAVIARDAAALLGADGGPAP